MNISLITNQLFANKFIAVSPSRARLQMLSEKLNNIHQRVEEEKINTANKE